MKANCLVRPHPHTRNRRRRVGRGSCGAWFRVREEYVYHVTRDGRYRRAGIYSVAVAERWWGTAARNALGVAVTCGQDVEQSIHSNASRQAGPIKERTPRQGSRTPTRSRIQQITAHISRRLPPFTLNLRQARLLRVSLGLGCLACPCGGRA